MTANPIRKVLSTMQAHDVRCLLMGGQACVFYGAAEFSRDTDLALLAEPENLERLRRALDELQAGTIAVPPFEMDYLLRGHAVHFRCAHPEASGMRIDVMSILRGLPAFPVLWDRRSTITVGEGESYELMSLPDLVRAKKTQRDKDWPMIRRLIEADVWAASADAPEESRIRFWLREARTPELIVNLANRFPEVWASVRDERPLLHDIEHAGEAVLREQLRQEEDAERAVDRAYWEPLRRELEALRHGG